MAKPPRKSTARSRAASMAANVSPPPTAAPIPAFFQNTTLQSFLLFVFALLLYANTLTHGFVQDDAIVITDNMFTTQGVEGIRGILTKDTFFGFFKVEGKETLVSGGRYRPLTLVVFALIYEFFGAQPFVYHLLTVLLYAATCVLLYRVLLLLLRGWEAGRAQASLVAWIAALLFAAHPIHTEVVANIKGCDEIVALLGSLGALWLTVRYADTGHFLWASLAGIVFFLACLSKENSATFVAVIPLALWYFRRLSLGAAARATLPVWVGFAVFFVLRGAILNWKFGGTPLELMNNPFLKIEGDRWVPFTAAEKLATILFTLGKYVQLLVWPHPLTHDYYPRFIGIKTFANAGVLGSGLLYGLLVVLAIRGLRQREPASFGIWFYLLTISIVSNLVFPIGTNMGERFAFMPSVGFCLSAAVLLTHLPGWKATLGVALGGAAVFSVLTLLRNPVWESNERLFFTDAKTSVNSAKINNACSGVLFEKAQAEKDSLRREALFRQSLEYANRALSIYPNYKDAVMTRAGCRFYLKDYDGAVEDYRLAVMLSNQDERVRTNLALALRETGKYYGEKRGDLAKAERCLRESWQINPKDPETARLLGVAYGVQERAQEALPWFQKAVEMAPDNPSYLFDLGTAYYLAGDKVKGEAYRKRAVELDPSVVKQK
ncbi:MAG: tetratricopeptide repeat protein [Saprospiraceae bacterium]|nr:tetratricopeptide repeat protein [Saprospiraceae bacterium]MDW8229008.1 tetratricopeptide repeat protein [Saprospiraceae bacterium]